MVSDVTLRVALPPPTSIVPSAAGPTLGKRYVTLGRGSHKKSLDNRGVDIDVELGSSSSTPQHRHPFAKHGKARRRWNAVGHVAVAMLPQELLEMVFFWLETWETGAASQTCRAWYQATACDKRVWANAVLPVRNPVFTPMMGG